VLGGALTAVGAWVASGFLGWLPEPPRLLLLLAVALLLLVHQSGLVRVRLPQNARQVPQSVYTRHPVVANLQFGFEMGTGMRTLVTAVAPYLVLTLMLLFPPAGLTALVTGAAFGGTRGLVPMLWSMSADAPATRRRWDDLFARSRVMIGWASLLICSCGAALIVLAPTVRT
jgi:hypothetical protein